MPADDTITVFDGSELVVLERPAGPGDPLAMRFHLVSGCGSPPPHVHPHATEVFKVEEGEFEMLVRDEWRTVRAGETVTVPPGTRHTFRNESGAPVTVHNVHDPHCDFERYIRTIAALSHEHRTTAPNSPAAATKFSMVMSGYPNLIRPTDFPFRFAVPVLGAIGRALRLSLPTPA